MNQISDSPQAGIPRVRSSLRLVDAHQSGVLDYSSPLWALLMFYAFLGISGIARRSSNDSAPIADVV